MATSESKGELVTPITAVQGILLLLQLFVPQAVHVEQTRVTVQLMTHASQETVDQRTVQLFKPVLNVLPVSHQLLIVVTNHPPVVMTIPNMLHLALVGQDKVIVPIAT